MQSSNSGTLGRNTLWGTNTITNLLVDGIASIAGNLTIYAIGVIWALFTFKVAPVCEEDATLPNQLTTLQSVHDAISSGSSSYASSTGLIDGGLLSKGAGIDTFNLSSGSGVIVNNDTRVAINVSWSDFNNETVTGIAGAIATFVFVDSAGLIFQQTTQPTGVEIRTMIYIGVVVHPDKINVVTAETAPSYIANPQNQFRDFLVSLGPLNVEGNIVSGGQPPNELTIVKSAGYMFAAGVNYRNLNGKLDPNKIHLPAVNTAVSQFYYRLSDNEFGGVVNNIDTNSWTDLDVAPTPTATSPSKYYVQRVYVFSTNNLVVMYGQNEYGSMQAAKENFLLDPFEMASSLETAMLVSYIIHRGGATDLGDPVNCVFLNAGPFGGAGGAHTTGGSSTLQSAYDNSVGEGIQLDGVNPLLLKAFADGEDVLTVTESGGGSESFRLTENGDSYHKNGLTIRDIDLDDNSTHPNFVHVATNSQNIGIGVRAGENTAGGSVQETGCIAIGALAGASLQEHYAIAIGRFAGQNSMEGSTSVGHKAGQAVQKKGATAIGEFAGNNAQGTESVAIGSSAGQTSQGTGGNNPGRGVAVGYRAGNDTQGSSSIAVGQRAGEVSQGIQSVAIGMVAGASNQAAAGVAIGVGAGQFNQGANTVAIGYLAGQGQLEDLSTNPVTPATNQAANSICIGFKAGLKGGGTSSIFIGNRAGENASDSSHSQNIAIGREAGYTNQNTNCIAMGYQSGYLNQDDKSTAIGRRSGASFMRIGAVALGDEAGETYLGLSSIAIGQYADKGTGRTAASVVTNTIVLNATGAEVNNAGASTCVIAPIRSETSAPGGTLLMGYNPANKEVLQLNDANFAPTFDGSNLTNVDHSSSLLSASNAWTGTNTYNTNLPTSNLTPTSGTQFATKAYVDTTLGIGVWMMSAEGAGNVAQVVKMWPVTGSSDFLNTKHGPAGLTAYGGLYNSRYWENNILAGQGVGGANGTGSYKTDVCADADTLFLVYPGWGIKVWANEDPDTTGDAPYLNYENTNDTPQCVVGDTTGTASAIRIYYDGVLINYNGPITP